MNKVRFTIDGKDVVVPSGLSVRKASLKNGIYVPGLCSHPELNSFKPFNWSENIWQGEQRFEHDGSTGTENDFPHCDLCLVSINGGPQERACTTKVAGGLDVRTTGSDLAAARRESLKKILAYHPHACLTCAQKEGCDRIQCSMDVPVDQRCCELLGRCEIGKVADFIGIPSDTPAYRNENRPQITDEPLILRDYELCINCFRCVRVCRDVRGVDVLGAVAFDGRAKVGTNNGPTLPESYCKFCGACVELCPTGALRDQPDVKVLIDGQAPCVASCPLGIDVPGYLELIADGNDIEALELIRERAILPGVLGYACFHPCEDVCRRDALDDAVSICALKRYVSDVAADKLPSINKASSTDKRIAVIGGGPGGLAASSELLKCGHAVTIFDREDKLGGMLRQTIPNFRLPNEIFDRDLKYLYELGLQTRLGVEFGQDTDVDKLRSEGFEAVVLAFGLADAVRLGVEGEDLQNVVPGLDFLRYAARGEVVRFKGEVVIIGGGAVAVDAAMTSRRLGAQTVLMICLEAPEEMPAFKEELDTAREEGIYVINRWGVDRIDGENDMFKRVILKRCTSVFDEQGRFRPEYNPDEMMTVRADRLIVAIGQKPGGEVIEQDTENGIFIAGDAVTGPSSIVAAMADGCRAAREVDAYLGSFKTPEMKNYPICRKEIGRDKEFHNRHRVQPDCISVKERIHSMSEYISTLTESQARNEVSRCLRCNLRSMLMKTPLPPDPWQQFGSDLLEKIPNVEGVLILADTKKISVKIAGSANIYDLLNELIEDEFEAEYCRWEIDPMYTKRESELIQVHLQAFGEIPGGDELDDLF